MKSLNSIIFSTINNIDVDNRNDILLLVEKLHNNGFVDYDGNEYCIIKLCEKELGFGLCSTKSDFFKKYKNAKGVLFIGGTTSDVFDGKDKAIVVDKNLDYFEQRMVVANLLGDYLLDYLPNLPKDNNKLYTYEYGYSKIKNKTYLFACELLMPFEEFIKKYIYFGDLVSETQQKLQISFIFPWDRENMIQKYMSEYFKVPKWCIQDRKEQILYGFNEPIEKSSNINKVIEKSSNKNTNKVIELKNWRNKEWEKK